MPKHKPKRHTPGIDMTAMVDVAFLLLTFFILTTKFRAEERKKLDLPFSTGIIDIPADSSTMLISASPDGEVFIGFGDPGTRMKVLDKVLQNSSMSSRVTEAGKKHFSLLTDFGVPIQQFPNWLGKNAAGQPHSDLEMKEFPHRGIPLGDKPGTNNELVTWIAAARNVNIKMDFAIKGDNKVPMPTIEKIIHSLQEKKANKFYLITNMEGGGATDEKSGDAKGAEPAAAEGPKAP